jgi:hypothetical protein
MRSNNRVPSSECVVGKADSERRRLARRLYSDFVVDGTLNALFATEISFGCLNGNVTEQKLDLLSSPPAAWQNRAQVRRRSCGANLVRFLPRSPTPFVMNSSASSRGQRPVMKCYEIGVLRSLCPVESTWTSSPYPRDCFIKS